MRRFLFWSLPIAVSLLAASVFAYGFVAYLRGDIGTPVDFLSAAPSSAAPPTPAANLISPIILGDSLARGAGDETGLGIGGRLDQELRRRGIRARRTFNLGVNGARTADLVGQLERPNVRELLRESNVIVVSIGGNDLWGGSDWRNAAPPDPEATMSGVLGRIETVIARIRAVNPKARIFLVGVYNPFAATPAGKVLAVNVNRWNTRLTERFGNDPDFVVVATADLFSHKDRLSLDRFHPSGEGYGLIARRIADAL